MRRELFGVLALAVVLGVLLAAGGVSGAGPVTGVLSGPSALAPGGSGIYYLNVSGGPASEAPGNVSIKAYLQGTDLTGAQPPDRAHPITSVSNGTGPFTINITAPNKDQVITLIVEVGSAAAGRHENTTVSKAITVITPILLTATFRNDGGAAALDVPVKFFIDGKVAGATNISRIDPGQTGTAKLSYLPVGLAVGGHTVRVEADLNRNGVIEPDKGEVAVVDLFYKKDFELTWPYAALIMGATVSVSYLVIRARRRRR